MNSMKMTAVGAIALALAYARLSIAGTINVRQSGVVDPGVASNCVAFDTAFDSTYDCSFFERYWGISPRGFHQMGEPLRRILQNEACTCEFLTFVRPRIRQ